MSKIQPIVKWSGSKRLQAGEIISYLPNEPIRTFYEPFCGSCAVTIALLQSEDHQCEQYVCSDTNRNLMEVYRDIQDSPTIGRATLLASVYKDLWEKYNSGDIQRRKEYYTKIRNEYNNFGGAITHTAMFLFLNRTAYNGLVRYNSKGEFNSPCHFSRPGLHPNKMRKLLVDFATICINNNVRFRPTDYAYWIYNGAEVGDFFYFDPPYHGTKGMYGETFNEEKFWKDLRWLNMKGIKWALSYDGKVGDDDYTYEVPKELYERHIYIKSGNSSFQRLKGDTDKVVYESLYLNY